MFVCLVFLILNVCSLLPCGHLAEKVLTSWLLLVMFIVTFPCGILGQVWYLIVSFPDLCSLSYFGDYILIITLPNNVSSGFVCILT